MGNYRQKWTVQDLKNHLPARVYAEHSDEIIRLGEKRGDRIVGENLTTGKKVSFHVNDNKAVFFSLFPYSKKNS